MKPIKEVKPIRPSEISKVKQASPYMPLVIAGFNTIIAKHFDGKQSHFKQDEALKEIIKNFNAADVPMPRARLFDENMMDVEPIFETAGWIAKYDGGDPYDSSPITWTFKKKNSSMRPPTW